MWNDQKEFFDLEHQILLRNIAYTGILMLKFSYLYLLFSLKKIIYSLYLARINLSEKTTGFFFKEIIILEKPGFFQLGVSGPVFPRNGWKEAIFTLGPQLSRT